MKTLLYPYWLRLLALVAVVSSKGTSLHRHKRYLVYPDGGPARAQFIIGLGVPVDLEEQSVTVGTVIKFQYDLPTNSTEYTSRIYGFANTIESRDMENNIEEENNAQTDDEDKNNSDGNIEIATAENDLEDDNNTLIDLVFDNENVIRNRRAVYMEGGTDVDSNMLEYDKGLSLQEAIQKQEQLDQEYRAKVPKKRKTNRFVLYKIMEKMMERYGYSGRPCLLRTVCEAAEIPFTHKNGLLGEITHILFTPSSSAEPPSHHTDNEYHAAERLGRELGVDCGTLFPECEASLLETFTQIGFDTLHKFGL